MRHPYQPRQKSAIGPEWTQGTCSRSQCAGTCCFGNNNWDGGWQRQPQTRLFSLLGDMPGVPLLPDCPQLAALRRSHVAISADDPPMVKTCWTEDSEQRTPPLQLLGTLQQQSPAWDVESGQSLEGQAAVPPHIPPRPPRAPVAALCLRSRSKDDRGERAAEGRSGAGAQPSGEGGKGGGGSAAPALEAPADKNSTSSESSGNALPLPRPRSASKARMSAVFAASRASAARAASAVRASLASLPSPRVALPSPRPPHRVPASPRALFRRSASDANTGGREISQTDFSSNIEAIARQLVNAAYGRSLPEEQAENVLAFCPEIRWLAECALGAPPPAGGGAGARDARPLLAPLGQLARLALHARRAPEMARCARAWVLRARNEALHAALREQEGWSGPHFDCATSAEYWYCQATGLSSWTSPAAATTYLAHIADRLLSCGCFAGCGGAGDAPEPAAVRGQSQGPHEAGLAEAGPTKPEQTSAAPSRTSAAMAVAGAEAAAMEAATAAASSGSGAAAALAGAAAAMAAAAVALASAPGASLVPTQCSSAATRAPSTPRPGRARDLATPMVPHVEAGRTGPLVFDIFSDDSDAEPMDAAEPLAAPSRPPACEPLVPPQLEALEQCASPVWHYQQGGEDSMHPGQQLIVS